MKCKFLHYFHLFIPNSKLFTFGSTLEQRLSRDANQAQSFFLPWLCNIACTLFEKCFISNFSFFQKLVPLSLRRHLQTLRYQRSSTKSRLKITSSRLLQNSNWLEASILHISEDISQSICQYQHAHCEYWRSFYNFLVISIIFILGWKNIARSRPESI